MTNIEDVNVTPRKVKALRAVRDHEPASPTTVAKTLHPDHDSWDTSYDLKDGDQRHGVGIVWSVGGFLGHLRKEGLVERVGTQHHGSRYRLTHQGRKVLDHHKGEHLDE